jgi:hypothetical protein
VGDVRFVWAVVAFILAALMIGAGIAQRTIFPAPEAQSIPVQTDSDAAYTLVDGAVLSLLPGSQTLTVEGDGPIFAAYGRTDDVTAWLSDVEYNHVTVGAEPETVETDVVEPEATPSPSPAPTAEGEEAADASAEAPRDPVGSDLWLDEFQQEDELSTPLQLPDTMSVLIASDGVEPAPAELTFTWPVTTSTPWTGPLVIGGAIVLLVGIFLYILGIRHARRSRGPRRKGLPMPATEPIEVTGPGADKGVISAGRPRRRAVTGGRRGFVVVPVLAASALVLAGCSADVWPQFDATASATPTPTIIVPESQQAPAVTQAQAERIVTRVSAAVAEADAAMDPALASARLSGAALAERETNYALRGQISDAPALPAIPDQPVEIVLPQAFDGWPRTFLTVVEGAADTATAPTIMLLTQDDPWSEYRASYVANLEASTNLPELAAPYVGAVLAPPDSPFLLLPPTQLAEAYADVIDNGESSASWSLFDTADPLRSGIQTSRQQSVDELNQTGEGTASLAFDATAGTQAPLALTTQDGGAIVAVDVLENETATPTDPDAVIRLGDSPTVRALTGIEQSARGFTTTYADQVFFYVPLRDSGEQIRVLGYRSNILEAREIP